VPTGIPISERIAYARKETQAGIVSLGEIIQSISKRLRNMFFSSVIEKF